MNVIRFLLIMMVNVIILVSNIAGQQKIKPQSALPSTSFDLSTNKLPPRFTGENPAFLFKQLEKAIPERGEFESTESYLRRIHSIDTNKMYAFTDNLEKSAVSSLSYNPDEQEWEIKDSFISSIILRVVSSEMKSYIARNAYNTTVRVRRYLDVTYGVRNNNKQFQSFDCVIPMSPEKAKLLKNRMRVLYICTLFSPPDNPGYLIYGEDYKEPKLSDPEEAHSYNYKLEVNLKAIFIYDELTGEILKKLFSDTFETNASFIRPTHIKPDISQLAINKIEPEYPKSELKNKSNYIVIIEVALDKEGNVIRADAVYGNSKFYKNAERAARQWKFKIENFPENSIGTITLNFIPAIMVAPIPLTKPKLEYTPEALKKKTGGTIKLNVLVGVDGDVKQVSVMNGLPDGLDEKAIKAVYEMKFKPGTKNGKPIDYWKILEIEFNVN